jgi:hypothetical protein
MTYETLNKHLLTNCPSIPGECPLKCGRVFSLPALASHYVNSCLLSGFKKQYPMGQAIQDVVSDTAKFVAIKELYDQKYEKMISAD